MAGVRAVGAAGRGLGSSNTGSAGRRSLVRVGIRCSPCRPCSMGDPVARGVRGRALSLLRLPSSWGLPAPAIHVLWARVCGSGGPALSPWLACLMGAACRGGGGGPSPGGVACHRCEGRLASGAVPPPTAGPHGELSGSTTHVLWARVCGYGGPALSAWLACLVGAAWRGGGGGPSPGGVSRQRCEGRLVSGAVPRPVCPGCGWCGRGDPAPALAEGCPHGGRLLPF